MPSYNPFKPSVAPPSSITTFGGAKEQDVWDRFYPRPTESTPQVKNANTVNALTTATEAIADSGGGESTVPESLDITDTTDVVPTTAPPVTTPTYDPNTLAAVAGLSSDIRGLIPDWLWNRQTPENVAQLAGLASGVSPQDQTAVNKLIANAMGLSSGLALGTVKQANEGADYGPGGLIPGRDVMWDYYRKYPELYPQYAGDQATAYAAYLAATGLKPGEGIWYPSGQPAGAAR